MQVNQSVKLPLSKVITARGNWPLNSVDSALSVISGLLRLLNTNPLILQILRNEKKTKQKQTKPKPPKTPILHAMH